MELKYLIIAFCLILGVFLIYKETARPNKGWLVARIITSVIAVLAMGLLILPFSYTVTSSTRINELVLVTQGTGSDSLTTLKNTALYTTDSLVFQAHKNPVIKFIPDLFYHLKTHSAINSIQVYGYGLPEAQLSKLAAYTLNFHFPAERPDGIISCDWNSHLKSTEPLLIQGLYNNTSDKPVLLILKGLGSSIDSITVAAKEITPFSFSSTPSLIGKAVYQLVVMRGRETLKSEKVPFEVTGPQQLKILILASAPDFEYKFLKNWLYENKYSLAVRTTISKNKHSSDHLNMESGDLNRINTSLLQNFDVVIADEIELSSLSQSEKSAIYSAADQGLGLIVRVNDAKPGSGFSKGFAFYSTDNQKDKIFTPSFADLTPLKPLSFEQTLFIKAKTGEQSIISDQNSKILVSSKIYGQGKIVASTIPATYSWMLSGNLKEYTTFWSGLISKTARQLSKPGNWSVTPALPVVRQQSNIELESNPGKIPAIRVNNLSLQAKQNDELPFLWDASFWTDKTGWNTILVELEKPQNFYVYDKSDWNSVINEQVLRNNKTFFNNNLKQNNISVKSDNTFEKTVPSWITFSLFLIAISFLWFELKFLNKN